MFGILDNIDFALIYSSVNVLIFFYGLYILKWILNKKVEGKGYQKFILFVILIILIGQVVTFSLIQKIPFLEDNGNRSLIALIFILWSYAEFDRVVLKSMNPFFIKSS